MQTALRLGELELKGQFMLGSNYTFLVTAHHGGRQYPAVYKPLGGEQPLWDFPDNTLALREVAAYLVSEVLGFHFVPYTTLRTEGPHGAGSLQQYIQYDPEYNYFNFTPEDRERLRPVALFDLLANNADRKGSHMLIENGTGKLWLIDHGICFHEQDKLRTVIWDFAGQPIPEELQVPLRRVTELRGLLEPYLSRAELTALERRARSLLRDGIFPFQPSDRRAMPWPML
jgi:uncharacterized repeat protein (TIGR03843 family)